MSRLKTTPATALIGRYALPSIVLVLFVWIIVENKSRQARVDPRSGLDAAGMPFQAISTTGIVIVSCLTILSLLFALRRRGVIAGLLAAVALFFLFFLRLNSFWPD